MKKAEKIFREMSDKVGFPKKEQDHFVDIFLTKNEVKKMGGEEAEKKEEDTEESPAA